MRLPTSVPLDKAGVYCINCLADRIQRFVDGEGVKYRCLACKEVSPRAVIIDDVVAWWLDEERNYWHERVGLIVLNKANKILCTMESTFPASYTIPSHHMVRGEDPDALALRTLKEVIKIPFGEGLEPFTEFDSTGDSCRRGSEHHRWHIYRLWVPNEDDFKFLNRDMSLHWFTLAELRKNDYIAYALKIMVTKMGEDILKKKK